MSNNKEPECGVNIQVVPIDAVLDFGFGQIHGLEELQQLVEKSLCIKYREGEKINIRKRRKNSVHVGELWAPYPVFDSFDVGDDRSYQSFIIRNRPITDSEMRTTADAKSNVDYCCLHALTPNELLPMVYYKGEGATMLVATKDCGSSQESSTKSEGMWEKFKRLMWILLV